MGSKNPENSKKRIMFVGAQNKSQGFNRFLSSEEEYSIAFCKGFSDGIRELRENRYNYVVCSVDIRGEDGIAFLEKARSIQPNVVCVLITSGEDNRVVRKAYKKGINVFFEEVG